MIFIAAQILVALLVVVAVSMTNNWAAVGHFFSTLTVLALTGVLAAPASAALPVATPRAGQTC